MQVETMTAEGPCDAVLERALAHANDCAIHSRDLEAMERHLDSVREWAERMERSRNALLRFVHETEEFIGMHEAGELKAGLTVDEVVAALTKGVNKARAAHEEAEAVRS